MSEKQLSTLIETSNRLYTLSNSFANTWVKLFEKYRADVLELEDALKADGYTGIDDAIADISNHVTGDDAVAMEKNLTKAKELGVALNAYNSGGTVAERMEAIKTAIKKLYAIIGDLSRV